MIYLLALLLAGCAPATSHSPGHYLALSKSLDPAWYGVEVDAAGAVYLAGDREDMRDCFVSFVGPIEVE